MIEALKTLLKQPYWVIALLLGVVLVALPCITIEKDHRWSTHPPTTILLPAVGLLLVILSAAVLVFTLRIEQGCDHDSAAGIDLSRVKEVDGELSTVIGGCEIRVIEGRLEEQAAELGTVVVLPCNEYFDDKCTGDTKSALGAYVNRVFDGQVEAFVALVNSECKRTIGQGMIVNKRHGECGESFGVGRCILIPRPLGKTAPVALVSTTTQRAGEGLNARISYLFDGMRQLVACLADERLGEIALPVLGSGHGGVSAPLAFVGTVLAIAEAARYGQGGRCLKRATIVVFKPSSAEAPQVNRTVARRALALIAMPGAE